MKRFAILISVLMLGIILPLAAQSNVGQLWVRNHSSYVINFYLDGNFIGSLVPLTESKLPVSVGTHTISGVAANNSNSTWGPSQFVMTENGYVENYWDSNVAVPQMTWFKIINKTNHTLNIDLDGRTLPGTAAPNSETVINLSVGSHTITATADGLRWGPFTFYDTSSGWDWTLTQTN
jgi:hypothetical protein